MSDRLHPSRRSGCRFLAFGLSALGATILCGMPRPAVAQVAGMPAAEEPELPHAFFTHMGLPEGVGNFNLRVLGVVTRADGRSDGDVAFHLETGLTRRIGLHIRNDRFLDSPRTEAMFQFTALVPPHRVNDR